MIQPPARSTEGGIAGAGRLAGTRSCGAPQPLLLLLCAPAFAAASPLSLASGRSPYKPPNILICDSAHQSMHTVSFRHPVGSSIEALRCVRSCRGERCNSSVSAGCWIREPSKCLTSRNSLGNNGEAIRSSQSFEVSFRCRAGWVARELVVIPTPSWSRLRCPARE